jgi:hypothetical protein
MHIDYHLTISIPLLKMVTVGEEVNGWQRARREFSNRLIQQ